MTTIKVFAAHQEQLQQLQKYLSGIIEGTGANANVETHLTTGIVQLKMIHGVYEKDFPAISINNHSVWQKTLPPEDVVISWLTWPSSVKEAVEKILSEMPLDKLTRVLSDPILASGLEQGIRNGFGLWTGNESLRRSCGSETIVPDDASRVIVEALKKRCCAGGPGENRRQCQPSSDNTPHVNTPADFLLTWAFNLTSESEQAVRQYFPHIANYRSGFLFGDVLQVAVIIATMLRLERDLERRDYTAFHKTVVDTIAPAVRERYLPAMKDLCRVLFGTNPGITPAIPNFTPLLEDHETEVTSSIALWVVWSIKTTEPSDALDLHLARALDHLLATHAQMITSMIQRDKELMTQL